MDKRSLACILHFFLTGILLKVLGNVGPLSIAYFYCNIANVFFYLLLARFSYEFLKRYYVTENVDSVNKAVLITGCDSGFGLILAERLDSKGFHVFAACLSSSGDGAKQLKKHCSERLLVLDLDVTKDASVDNAVQFVQQHLTKTELWAVVNNAGVLDGFGCDLGSVSNFQKCLEVNTLGTIRVARAFLPFLRKSKGRVVNVTSMSGRLPTELLFPYSVSKCAAVAFTTCLRREMAVWGVDVISIEPEVFVTPMTKKDIVKKRVEASLSHLEPNVRSAYGEKYLKAYGNIVTFFLGSGSTKIHLVIDALEASVSEKYPHSTYEPRWNFFTRTIFYIAERLPDPVLDFIYCTLTYFIILPPPKKKQMTSPNRHFNCFCRLHDLQNYFNGDYFD